MPLQAHSEFNDFLNLADVHLVIQKASASDLVMPSKLTTILAVGGLAIITANPGSGLYSLVKEQNIGVLGMRKMQRSKGMYPKGVAMTSGKLTGMRGRYAEDYLSTERFCCLMKHYPAGKGRRETD